MRAPRRAAGRPLLLLAGRSASSGRSIGTTITRSATIVAPRSAASRAARSTASCDSRAGDDRHEDRAVLERDRRPELERRAAPSRASGCRAGAGRRRRRRSPAASQRKAGVARRRVLDDDDEPGEPGRRCRRGSRRAASSIAPEPRVRADAVRLLDRRRLAPQLDHRRVRDREREHRAERVHPADEVDVPGQHEEDREERRRTRAATSHGVLNFGCSRRKTSGSCRWLDIEYVIRDAPITPAFVAMKRIVAARTPT